MEKILLRNILECTSGEQLEVLKLRNKESIRRNMYSDHIITESEHLKWLVSLKKKPEQQFFIIFVADQVKGAVSLAAFDFKNRKCDWAFYLDETVRGGLGAAIEYYFVGYVFDKLKIEKLNCEVLSFNESVIKMHKKFGFQEEGIRRSNILKDSQRIDVVLLGMTAQEWTVHSESVKERYQSILNKFDIKMA